jgi:hypothetical protein
MMVGITTAAVIWYPTRTAQTALPRFKNIIKITAGNSDGVRACACVRLKFSVTNLIFFLVIFKTLSQLRISNY